MNRTGLKIFPVLGNHDAYPHNQFHDDPKNEFYQNTAEIWKDTMGWPNEAYQQFKSHGKLRSFRILYHKKQNIRFSN